MMADFFNVLDEEPSGTVGTAIQVTPEDYGALRDGTAVSGVGITSGAATLTAVGSSFTGADVGKTIAVYGAGTAGNGTVLVTTISAVTSATQVTLAANASATVADSRAVYGTDDAEAIADAIADAVVQGVAAGTHYAEVILSPGLYVVARAGQTGSPTFGNAQIPLPVVAEAGVKFELVIRGTGSGGSATFGHWNQETPQRSGAVLYSTLVGGTSHATYGPPAVIGGPSVADGSAAYDQVMNMKLVIDGVTIVVQRNPSVTGVHAGRVAQLHVKSLGVLADMTPGEMNAAPPTNDLGLGLRVPQLGNNHYVRIDDYAVEGVYYGMTIADHLTASRIVIVYCNTGMFIGGGGANEHGASILNLGVEATPTVLEASFSSGGRFPIDIRQCNTELVTSTAFKDSNDALVGTIQWTDNGAAAPTVSGCANLTLIDLNRRPGAIAGGDLPAVPASTTPLTNPFYKHCTVRVIGGTVSAIAVDGQATGATSGLVRVPTGKTITLTYSVAPTWTWWAD